MFPIKRSDAEQIDVGVEFGDEREAATTLAYDSDIKIGDEISGFKVIADYDGVRLLQKGDQYIISHRGTRKTSFSDISTDANLALGRLLYDREYLRRVEATRDLVTSLPADANITLVGHSLGGTTAVYALNDPIINDRISNVTVFNPGTTYDFLAPRFTGTEDKVKVIVNERDPIRFGTLPGEKISAIDNTPLPELPLFPRGNVFLNVFSHSFLK